MAKKDLSQRISFGHHTVVGTVEQNSALKSEKMTRLFWCP